MDEVRRAHHNVLAAIRPCPKPKGRGKKSARQKLMLELSDVCREITHWVDGRQCVLRGIDGIHCNQEIHWSHVVAQGQSAYLRHDLSNARDTCGSHNMMHARAPSLYFRWYQNTFGARAFNMLDQARLDNNHYKFSIMELQDRLGEYRELYATRYLFAGAPIEDLVMAGYYGQIIRAAWILDKRLEPAQAESELT